MKELKLNNSYRMPSQEDIDRTISRIKSRLEEKAMNMAKNYGVKEGYQRAISNIERRESDISNLKTVQGRAIAAIAYDYTIGMCEEDVLCLIPIKTR